MQVVAGLDKRFGWTGGLPVGIHFAGAVLFLLGLGLFSWAMISNAHFSTVARVRQDRGHAVCTRGPYQFVRHPGYLGAIVQSLAVPLILGSLWALIPGALAAVLMVARTALEDRTLQEELDGYEEYTHQVRYRLLPGIW
jgi:protein-S-isoprenylcysteine O-methyltransferase Ste14